MIMLFFSIASATTLSGFVWTTFEMKKQDHLFPMQFHGCYENCPRKDLPLQKYTRSSLVIAEWSHLEQTLRLPLQMDPVP